MKKTFKMLLVLFLAGVWCVGCSGENGHADDNEPAMIQTFTESDVAVIPVIEEYDFMTAKDMGAMQQIRGMLFSAAISLCRTESL